MFPLLQTSNNRSVWDCGGDQKCLWAFILAVMVADCDLKGKVKGLEMKDIHQRLQREVDGLVENVKYSQSHHSQKTRLRVCFISTTTTTTTTIGFV